MENDIKSLVSNARKAQQQFEKFSQEQVDDVVRELAKVIFDNAEPLARMAVDETRMGVYEDKVKKNRMKPRIIWNSLKNKKSMGIIKRDEKIGIIEIAKPMGVVGAITPCTNPIVTPMCNAMFALKGKNAVIIAPHPRAKKCAARVVELYNNALAKFKVPKDLIQYIAEPSVAITNELMKEVDIVVATGGMGMVKSAYSSGTPSLGVGVGNVQCIIDRNVNLGEAVTKIIAGRIFDNGIICSGEQCAIVPEENLKAVIAEFIKGGAYYVESAEELDKLRNVLFKQGAINGEVVGQSVEKVAGLAGLKIPGNTKVILARVNKAGKSDILNKEKMCPVISIITYKNFDEAIEIARENLAYEGNGHSVSIHSENKENIEKTGLALTVCRVVVNQPCSSTAGGSFFNGLTATTTLGCGSWGHNSISENLDYKHLINITRVAFYNSNAVVPSEDEMK